MKTEKVTKVTLTEDDVKTILGRYVASEQGLDYGQTQALDIQIHCSAMMQIEGDEMVPVGSLHEIVVIGAE